MHVLRVDFYSRELGKCREVATTSLAFSSPLFRRCHARSRISVGELDTLWAHRFHAVGLNCVFCLLDFVHRASESLRQSIKYKVQTTNVRITRALRSPVRGVNYVATKQAFQEELNPYAIAKQQFKIGRASCRERMKIREVAGA